eukprot:3833011-Rhodomonas_salina.1
MSRRCADSEAAFPASPVSHSALSVSALRVPSPCPHPLWQFNASSFWKYVGESGLEVVVFRLSQS